MSLKDVLDAAIAEGKKLGGELLTDLINQTHNPAIAQIIFELAQSHVEQTQTLSSPELRQARAQQAAAAAQAAAGDAAHDVGAGRAQ